MNRKIIMLGLLAGFLAVIPNISINRSEQLTEKQGATEYQWSDSVDLSTDVHNNSMVLDQMDTTSDESLVYLSNRKRKVLNVKEHGAVGDGVTDDYEAVTKAIDQAIVEGKAVYFPTGVYYLSRKIILNQNTTIVGENKESVVLLFKDKVYDGPVEPHNQRGLVTLVADQLNISGVTIRYQADVETDYTRVQGQSGIEGVLFSVLKGSKISFSNCSFVVTGSKNPSVTCMWIKSEVFNINNIKISSCDFINDTTATVGGLLWISAHDSEKTVVQNVEVTKCAFLKKGNDEALSVWGYHLENIIVNNNYFEFSGNVVQNDSLIAFGSTVKGRQECLKNIRFVKNIFNLCGKFGKLICVQVLTNDSNVEVSDNTINGMADKNVNVNCFAVYESGNSIISNNVINIDGADMVTYVAYTGGNSTFLGNTFKVKNCNNFRLVRSPSMEYFNGANLRFEKDSFDIGAISSVSGEPMIQYPSSGKLVLSSCKITTTLSAFHELNIQTIYPKEANFNFSDNMISLDNCLFDTSVSFKLSRDSKTSISLSGTKLEVISFYLDENHTCLNSLDIMNTSYRQLKYNDQEISLNDMAGHCQQLITK